MRRWLKVIGIGGSVDPTVLHLMWNYINVSDFLIAFASTNWISHKLWITFHSFLHECLSKSYWISRISVIVLTTCNEIFSFTRNFDSELRLLFRGIPRNESQTHNYFIEWVSIMKCCMSRNSIPPILENELLVHISPHIVPLKLTDEYLSKSIVVKWILYDNDNSMHCFVF